MTHFWRIFWTVFGGAGKRGHFERDLLLEQSPESLESLDSLESQENGRILLYFPVWGFSKISGVSNFSRISREWTFLKRPLFQKTPFSEPAFGGLLVANPLTPSPIRNL